VVGRESPARATAIEADNSTDDTTLAPEAASDANTMPEGENRARSTRRRYAQRVPFIVAEVAGAPRGPIDPLAHPGNMALAVEAFR
jgi:hypothetical protein